MSVFKKALFIAAGAGIILPALVSPASAYWDRHHHWVHREYRGDREWSGGYYSAPPVVYGGVYAPGATYYPGYYTPPPVVYAPPTTSLFGINLHIK